MEVPLDHPAGEIRRLQRCINDLVSILALPAMWTGAEPSQIVNTLLDTLLGMFRLDFVYVRLKDSAGEAPMEMVRIADSQQRTTSARKIGEMLDHVFDDDPQQWPALLRSPIGDGNISILPLPLGLHGEVGLFVTGSERTDFPEQTERLLLSVAANQTSIALREARLLNEQKRVADELDKRVAQRTAEWKQAQEELRDTQAALAHMTRVMTMAQLTASIAHEVNQPLSGIITNASTCLRMLAADPPNVDGALETTRRTIRDGNRASEVITRLRALYTRKEASPESMDLNEATREVIALSLSELQRNRVVLRLELTDDLPLVTGDRVQLQQVIMNLLRNASDAMSGVENRPRQLVIRTEGDEGGRVRLTVRDAGVGFDPRAVDRLFQAFYTTKSDGMGMGLSVSRSIIESHDGCLSATLNEGPGATFSFSIPCASRGTAGAGSLRPN